MLTRLFYVAVFLCLLWAGGLVYLRHERDTLERMHLANQTTTLSMAWQAVIKPYKFGTQAYFDAYVMQPRVLEILRRAQGSSDADQAIQRVRLYRHLYPVYQKLQAKNVRQLHFHTPDCRSFLRFHLPHYSGDSLTAARPSVVMANRDHKVIQGFETGRVVAGFRNVFPIIHEGEHLGSVEISQPFEALRKEMRQLDTSNDFMLVYNAPLLLPKLFEGQKTMYTPSLFSPDWLVEDKDGELHDSSPSLSVTDQKVYAGLAGSPAFALALAQDQPCSIAVKARDGFHMVTFLPLIDLEGLTAAALISFSAAPEVDEIYRNYRLHLLSFSLLMLFCSIAFLLFLKSQQAVAEKKRDLQLIANTMNDGLFVINDHGVITFVNDTVSDLLGYSRNELLGQVAHDLFHFHDYSKTPLSECPIFNVLLNNTCYTGEEVFSRKDGTSFVAEVASEPMFKNGRIVSSVTIVREITERKQSEIALQEAHDKMDLLSNNIETQIWSLVTPDTYGAVNRAHADFCGFVKEAMEHKTLYELFSPEVAETCLESNLAVFDGKCQIRIEAWVCNAKGERRLLSLIKTPKLGADGQVEYAICSGEDITDRKQMEEQLLQLCNTDPLTKAFNRRYFLQILETEVQRSQRYATPFSLVMCDIDHFKRVNDTFGHEAGDQVLQTIVTSIHERVRSADVFARWGGEEFVLLLTNTSLSDAVPLVENILENIRLVDFGEVGGITVSCGVTTYGAMDTIDILLNRADNLLYEAKAAGRNCVKASG